MHYYVNPIWFYLMNVCNSIKFVAVFALVCCTICCVILFIGYLDYCEEEEEDSQDSTDIVNILIFKKILSLFCICLTLAIFVPSKETCKEMIVASLITEENVDVAKDSILEIVDHIIEKVNDTDN